MRNSSIKQKTGQCKWEGCDYHGPLLAGYCQTHYWMHRQQKKTGKIKKHMTTTYKPTGERAFFDAIWSDREHFSWLSNLPLDKYKNSSLYVNMFAHILPKGGYGKWRLKDKNIILLTPEEHRLFDQGTEEERQEYEYMMQQIGRPCRWEELYELVKEYKNDYRRENS